jgi:eukaryotic-like serine/threonine-protein kinase
MFLASLEGGPARFLGESDTNVLPVSGSLLFLSHGKLMSQPLDLERGAMDAHADIVAEGVSYDPGSWYGSFTATAAEVLYRPRHEKRESNTIAWFDRKGNKLGEAAPPGFYRELSLAPDGKTIATACGETERNVCLTHGDGTVTQVTHAAINGFPAWASDSTFFSYYTHRGHTDFAIAVKPLDEKTSGSVVTTAPTAITVTSWHPDKRHALLSRDIGNGTYAYFIFDLATNKITPYLSSDLGLNDYARFSPDGNWIAYSKQSNGNDQIHVASYPVPISDFTITNIAGRGPKWRGDGHEIYFLGPGDNLYAVPVSAARDRLNFGPPQILFHPAIPPAPWDLGAFDVSRDGNRFLLNTVSSAESSELVLTTNWQH